MSDACPVVSNAQTRRGAGFGGRWRRTMTCACSTIAAFGGVGAVHSECGAGHHVDQATKRGKLYVVCNVKTPAVKAARDSGAASG